MLIVSSEVLKAIAEGKKIDEEFDAKVREEFKKDIRVLNNLEKVSWNSKPCE